MVYANGKKKLDVRDVKPAQEICFGVNAIRQSVALKKGFKHCGQCTEMPCTKLKLLFGDPEHGDGGARLHNLQNWNNGNYVYEMLDNVAQEKAKEL